MRIVLLAAGYATRLWPLTRDVPKALLDVGGVPLLTRLLERLLEAGDDGVDPVSEVVVVSNARFADAFRRWSAATAARVPLRVLDDGTTSEAERLGAVGDLAFALRTRPPGDESLLVAAADNLIEIDWAPVLDAFRRRRAPLLVVRRVGSRAAPSAYNEVELDPDGRVRRFREKPPDPVSEWAALALYLFPGRIAGQVDRYLAAGGNPDAPGHFVAWLVEREPVWATPLRGHWHDVGTPETLAAARARYANAETDAGTPGPGD